jgi:hypothetical protein
MAGRHIFAFVLRTLTHAGPYGSGDVSTVSLPALAARLGRWLPPLATDEWFAVFAVVAAVACLAWGVRHSIPSQGPRRKAVWKRRLLAAILVAQVLQFLLALRSEQPYTRYLIPALSLAGLEVALAVDLVRASIPMRLKPMGAALLLAVLAGLGVSRAVSVLDSERSSEQGRLHRAALDSALAEQWPHARIIDCSVHSSQAAALWFANSWAGWQFSAALDRLHPGFLFLDRSSWLIWDFRGALADPAAALAGDRAVLLRSPLATPLDSSPHLRRVLTSRDEGIYVLDPAASRRDGPAPGKNTQPPAPPTSGRM